MTRIDKVILSDFLKLKRTLFLPLHILVPIIGICGYSAYAVLSPVGPPLKATGYFQALSFVFPIVISVLCTIVTEQEFAAGNGYNLLTATAPKVLSCLSKLALLIFFGLLAAILAVCGFGLIFNYILSSNFFTFDFYFSAACILLLSNIALYFIHFFVCLRWGKNNSLCLGIAESLVSALMATNLGDGIWYFIPCAWGTRFTTFWTIISVNKSAYFIYQGELVFGALLASALSLLILCFLMVWFWRWEGRKSYE